MAGPLYGQARGKIQGRVVDAATGAPIAGAQVTVEGTTFGNLTNDQGFYFINEVGAGEQSIRAQFIGYRAVVVENERILGRSDDDDPTSSSSRRRSSWRRSRLRVSGIRSCLETRPSPSRS